MRARLFSSLAEAEAARDALDTAARLPKMHGVHEYSVAHPGRAYARIRARGVRTDHLIDVVPNEAGTRFAVASGAPDAVEIDLVSWQGLDRRTPPPR